MCSYWQKDSMVDNFSQPLARIWVTLGAQQIFDWAAYLQAHHQVWLLQQVQAKLIGNHIVYAVVEVCFQLDTTLKLYAWGLVHSQHNGGIRPYAQLRLTLFSENKKEPECTNSIYSMTWTIGFVILFFLYNTFSCCPLGQNEAEWGMLSFYTVALPACWVL